MLAFVYLLFKVLYNAHSCAYMVIYYLEIKSMYYFTVLINVVIFKIISICYIALYKLVFQNCLVSICCCFNMKSIQRENNF